jgi:hypothetical protein
MSKNNDWTPDAVLRLAASSSASPFLSPHHVEAAKRLTRLFDRASLRQRVTMSYDPTRSGRRGAGAPAQGEIADSAADARARLGKLAGQMPRDCWDVLTDVCAFDKGLQDIEASRDWPRRGAKLVLRIGLEQLGVAFGLGASAQGRDWLPGRGWIEERPPMFRQNEN